MTSEIMSKVLKRLDRYLTLQNRASYLLKKIGICFDTTDLHNTKTKSKLNKHTTEHYPIFGYQIGETEN